MTNDQTRRIITSVDLISAAAFSPAFKRSSRAASAVMIDVICWPPIESVTWAISPSIFTLITRPTSWLRPLTRRKPVRRSAGALPSEVR
jgi:hypothetical protein